VRHTALFLLALSIAVGSTPYTVTVIPPPVGFTSPLTMYGINDFGQVAGTLLGKQGDGQAFIGSATGSAPIPFLPGWFNTSAAAINDLGQVAGFGGNQNVPQGTVQSFIGTPSGGSAIPLIPGWTQVQTSSINNWGQVAGQGSYNGTPYQAFIGTTLGSMAIPSPPGWNYALVGGLNNSGQVAGTVSGATTSQAFIGTISGSSLIPLPTGWLNSKGFAVNDSGQVAGIVYTGNSARAFIGAATAITVIPLPPGATYANLVIGSLNNGGSVVGYSDAGPWIWNATDGTLSLNALVPPEWNVTDAISISNNGRILAQASYNGGTPENVELIPTPSAPGCTFALALPNISVNSATTSASVNLSSGAGCSWNVFSNNPWLTITSSGSGSGSAAVSFQVTANPGTQARVGTLTVGGQTLTVTQIAPTPAPAGIVPASGSGTSQTFTFTFTDPAGYADLSVLDVLINNYLDGEHACYVGIVPANSSSGYLYLVDDAGDGGYVSGTPKPFPSSGIVQNSQCTIDAGASSVSANGNTLTVTLAITFASGFAGNRIVYVAARTGTHNSGWQPLGTWTVPGISPSSLSVQGMSPARSTAVGGIYTFTFNDSIDNWQGGEVVDILINSALDGTAACYIAYTQPNISFWYLVDDAGDGGYTALSPLALSSGNMLQNSQCTVYTAQSSASVNNSVLTLTLAIGFQPGFRGNQLIYAAARNSSGGNTGWQPIGSLTVALP
jgi:hypothetical protein